MQLLKFAAVLAAMVGTFPGRQQTPPLTDVITQVSNNVRALEASLPDYICKETLLRREIRKGALGRSQTTESLVTAVRVPGTNGFRVSKEVLSVSDSGNPPAMQDIVGLQSAGLARAFSPQNLPLNDYTLAGTEILRGVRALVINFASKEARAIGGKNPQNKVAGKAWIDTSSMRVMRLDMLQDVPNFQPRPSVADYGSVDIAGKEFWLLTTYTMTAYGGTVNQDMAYEWNARYSNCRKFEVTVEIKPVR